MLRSLVDGSGRWVERIVFAVVAVGVLLLGLAMVGVLVVAVVGAAWSQPLSLLAGVSLFLGLAWLASRLESVWLRVRRLWDLSGEDETPHSP